MIVETVRVVADWLGHATYGVQALLTAAAYDGADVAPSGTLTIIDITRSDDAAIGRDVAYPYIRVAVEDVLSFDGQSATYTHDADVPIVLTVVRQGSSPANLERDLYYTLRAMLQSVESLFNDTIAASVAPRTRNGVQLKVISAVGAARTKNETEDNTATAHLGVTISCRDTRA